MDGIRYGWYPGGQLVQCKEFFASFDKIGVGEIKQPNQVNYVKKCLPNCFGHCFQHMLKLNM